MTPLFLSTHQFLQVLFNDTSAILHDTPDDNGVISKSSYYAPAHEM